MMDRNLRTRLQAARWLLERVSAKRPDERIEFLRSETDDELLIELVEGLLENEEPNNHQDGHEILLNNIEMEKIDAVDLLREINGIPRRLGDFDISRPISRGGMGSVFIAEHRSTGVQYALKVAVGDTADTEEIRSLYRESEIIQKLANQEGIPDSLSATSITRDDQVIAYYAREFVRGTTIDDWIMAVTPELARVLELAIECCHIVEACHRAGIAHCDLKPSNILVGMDGSSPHLIDFGLAMQFDEKTLVTRDSGPFGHPAYTAPEARRDEPFDPRLADQFSIGLTIFTLLQKSSPSIISDMPGDATRMAELIKSSDLPHSVKSVLGRMTDSEPKDRFPSMESASNALLGVLKNITRSKRYEKTGSLRTRMGIGLATMSVIIIAGVCGWLMGNASTSPSEQVGAPPLRGDLNVAIEALDGGDIALASQILSALPENNQSWLDRHVRARIRSIYASAITDPDSIPSISINQDLETILNGPFLSTRDLETGELKHRWPAAPTWKLQQAHDDGAYVQAEDQILNLDVRRAAAAEIISKDAVPGTLFKARDGEIGWISKAGSIIIRQNEKKSDQIIPIPEGLKLEQASVASDGWSRLVIFDGGPNIHTVGLGPQLGMKTTVPFDSSGNQVELLALGDGHFLIYGTSDGCWILKPDDTIHKVPVEGTVRFAASTDARGARLLIHEGDSSSILNMSSSGGIDELPTKSDAARDAMLFAGDDSKLFVIGPYGIDILSEDPESTAHQQLGSLAEVRSVLMTDPRTLLLGGPWSGFWVLDPVSGCLRGHIDTGGEEIRAIMTTSGLGDVFTQDERGYVRRIPA